MNEDIKDLLKLYIYPQFDHAPTPSEILALVDDTAAISGDVSGFDYYALSEVLGTVWGMAQYMEYLNGHHKGNKPDASELSNALSKGIKYVEFANLPESFRHMYTRHACNGYKWDHWKTDQDIAFDLDNEDLGLEELAADFDRTEAIAINREMGV